MEEVTQRKEEEEDIEEAEGWQEVEKARKRRQIM